MLEATPFYSLKDQSGWNVFSNLFAFVAYEEGSDIYVEGEVVSS